MQKLGSVAGFISLAVLFAFVVFKLGYTMHEIDERVNHLKFRIVRVVNDPDGPETLDGSKPPYTVLLHESYVQTNVPGVLGNVGDIVYHADPRQSSDSSN